MGTGGSFMKFLWDVIWWQKGVKSYSERFLSVLMLFELCRRGLPRFSSDCGLGTS